MLAKEKVADRSGEMCIRDSLFSSFIVRCQEYSSYGGHLGFMCPFVWMFIKSYEWLRKQIISDAQITLSLIHIFYTKIDYMQYNYFTITDLKHLQSQSRLEQLDVNRRAKDEIRQFIEDTSSQAMRVTMKDVYKRQPLFEPDLARVHGMEDDAARLLRRLLPGV